jgi:hypothetical protein
MSHISQLLHVKNVYRDKKKLTNTHLKMTAHTQQEIHERYDDTDTVMHMMRSNDRDICFRH